MIGIDTAPLRFQPRSGVARALAELLGGLDRLAVPPAFVLLPPPHAPAYVSARLQRAAMRDHVAAQGVTVFFSPWSAFPRGLDVPVVVLVHELPFAVHGPIEGRVRAFRHRLWLRRAVRACAAILVPSRAVHGDLLALQPQAAGRVHVIGNAFDPAPWAAARRTGEPAWDAVMVGIGATPRMNAKKGLDVLLRAWPGGRLALVGPRPAQALPGGVAVFGDLEDDALRDLVASARMLVYPSRSEGFGYPPLEAMACGVPVVTTDAGSLPEVVGEAAYVVAAGDPQALARAIARVAQDEALRGRLIEAGLARVQDFEPAAVAARWTEALDAAAVRA
jgi:alpha-1,3-rhamnosyl/mannosyltransferase